MFMDFFKKRRSFRGIQSTFDADYNQIHLETAVCGMKDNRPDYCFVWSLCRYYTYYHRVDWPAIAEALRKVPASMLDQETGYVKSITGLTFTISKLLGVPWHIKRIAMIDTITEVDAIVRALSLETLHWFIMARYTPEHYTFVSPDGIEDQPYPGYSGAFYGWRIYKGVRN